MNLAFCPLDMMGKMTSLTYTRDVAGHGVN